MQPLTRRRIVLEGWLVLELSERFQGRILPVGETGVDRWGRLSADVLSRKAPLPVIEDLPAATALHNNLTLVTRNTRDIEDTGVPLFNPWL